MSPTSLIPEKPCIRQMLLRLGAISENDIEVFATRTRDNENLKVFRDRRTKVIFIDDYYVGDSEYTSGEYKRKPKPLTTTAGRDYEDLTDTERRYAAYRQFVVAQNVVDFGCGAGSFLKLAKSTAASVCGVELQEDFRQSLNQGGVPCVSSLSEILAVQDACFLFHCLEHLPDPLKILRDIREKLRSNGEGKIIVEVPHARDFLIDALAVHAFIGFTLWSQHLILHTRESLAMLLSEAGFKNISIEGVQRYGISNHLHWLNKGRPGGHKSPLSIVESPELSRAYAASLSRIDATDTIVAIATT